MKGIATPHCDFAWEYRLTSARLYLEDAGEYDAYGLQLYCPKTKTWGQAINDISTSETFVQNMAALLMNQQVEPIHFKDVVIDLISCPSLLNVTRS